jgi:AmmeMemoRadiSam system protein B
MIWKTALSMFIGLLLFAGVLSIAIGEGQQNRAPRVNPWFQLHDPSSPKATARSSAWREGRYYAEADEDNIPPRKIEGSTAKADEKIRKSILAGSWYPSDKLTLRKSIENYLASAGKGSTTGEIVAVIVPHAGHIYSGPVAAYAYNALERYDYKRVIMLGPSHRIRFRGVSVNLQSGYQTPLGLVTVDLSLASKFINANELIHYIPEAHANEHSLEIQLPFLQTIYEDFKIVPLLMGNPEYNTCKILSDILVKYSLEKNHTLILASTDLSHYHNKTKAMELDMEFIRHIENFDPEGLARSLSSGMCEACGIGPVITTMLAAKALGANRAEILNYATSGDVTGDSRRVVGYLSAIFIK